MRPPKETKEEKFIRLAEARVNKILSMMRLLGNLSSPGFYQYSRDQVEQIFTALQLELIKNKMRFLQPPRETRKRFSLSEPCEVKEPAPKDQPSIAIPLPDGSYLRAVGYPNDSYPSITIYRDSDIARLLKITSPTVSYRKKQALIQLKLLLEAKHHE